MKEYRTNEQFLEICEDMYNGNWTEAAQKCAEYGFWANDLKRKYEEGAEGSELIEDIWDFVELVEMAMKFRS
ncbi:MAG: hypothetical protein QXY47_05405 [Thermoplasmata archaeon]